MALIQSGTSTDLLTIDPTSKAARITVYDVSGSPILPLADTTITTRINTLGQKISANSTPVVLASDQSEIPISGTVISNIGTTNGLALDATLTDGAAKIQIYDGSNVI